ncbi:glycosyltransferase family 2 protein [Isoptericola sp. NPDC058082]|uniref:glycosyltransferase family 2 protein n=1 Tax=Isoptericola sp. NPDC058082 TaxID=3346331 RepID=UPI0036E00416
MLQTSGNGLPAPDVPPLEIVIVTYGGPTFVERCLTSVRHHAPRGTKVHVVDNASPDSTPDMVAHRFPEVLLHRRRDNSGFAVANNAALAGTTAPAVLLLNPDTELRPGVVEHLLHELEHEPEIGVLGCRLVTPNGSFDHASKRRVPSPAVALRYFLLRSAGRHGSDYTAPDLDEHDVGDVDAVNGAFMLVRAAALTDVGLLDETFWMYAEDLDWCVRMRAAGWRVVYDGRVTAIHLKGASSGRARSVRLNYHFHRSMSLFYRKHLRRSFVEDLVVHGGIWARFVAVAFVDVVRRSVARGDAGRPARAERA